MRTCAPRPSHLTAVLPLRGPASWLASSGSNFGGRLDPRAHTRHREAREHLRARRSQRRAEGGVSQDPHVRRGARRARLPRVGARAAGRGDRPVADSRRRGARPIALLRPALPRALSNPGRAGSAHRDGPGGVHAADDPRPLGDAAAGTRDREPGVCPRRQPGWRASGTSALGRTLDDRGPVGDRAGAGLRWRGPHRRGSGSRAPERDSGTPAVARQPPSGAPIAGPKESARECGADANPADQVGVGQASADPRRRRARVRPPGVSRLPGVGHRR